LKTLILFTILTLTGCGVAEDLRSHCGSDIEMGCNALFGFKNADQDKEIDELKKKNTEQDAKIADLQNQINNNFSFANSLQSQLSDVQSQINTVETEISGLQTQDTALQNQLSSLGATQILIQNQINTVQGNVTNLMMQMLSVNNALPVLQSNINGLQTQINTLTATVSTAVIGMVDPCGDGSGMDEVLLKTKDGKYVAYFETGGNRFLTVLQAGNSYQTTDSQHCHFSLNSSGSISW
jgi:peptidoglycan hydrolase CwlO-like protein